MKGSSCSFVASVFAASTTALASASPAASDVTFTPCCCEGLHSGSSVKSPDTKSGTATKDKFAPRFDGLRFIETLVTAHR
ncbi:hypothetical protein QQ045_020157 [Rhodiola kirilowii]